jgi:superfamily II DNA or RNA helicase
MSQPGDVATVELWPHQKAAINAVHLAVRAGRAGGLVVLPTGTGKTGFALSLARQLAVPTLFLVHRDELWQQTVSAAARFWPEAGATGVVCNGRNDWTGRQLVAAMVPTMAAGKAEAMPRDHFGLVIVDECHHAPAATWMKVLDHFTPGFLLGLTATPQRHDGKGLAARFGREPLYSYSLFQAIKDGRLCQVKPMRVTTETSLEVLAAAGDGEEGYSPQKLSAVINTPQRNLLAVDTYRRLAGGRRAVAFCADAPHARALARAFQDSGVPCRPVLGTTHRDARRELLDQFAAGDLKVVCNVEVLTEGFDDPGIDCLLMLRPTESRGLYLQMVGRGLRLLAGKEDCLVIDFVDLTSKHKLVSVLDLLGRQKEPKAEPKAAGPRREAPDPPPPANELPIVSWRLESVCPWPEMPSLEGYAPSSKWQDEPASDGQFRFLAALGLAAREGLTKGEASYLIDRAQEYEAAFPVPATPKQRYLLQQEGLWTEGMSKRQASSLIGQLKAAQKAS